MKNTILILLFIVFTITIFSLFFVKFESSSNFIKNGTNESFGYEVGKYILPFEFEDINGNKYSIKNFIGKPIIIHFIISNCPSCIYSLKNLRDVQNESNLRNLKVIVISIDPNDNVNELIKVKVNYGNPEWIFVRNPPSLDITNKLNVNFVDTTIVIDKNGKIVDRDDGFPDSKNRWKEILTKL